MIYVVLFYPFILVLFHVLKNVKEESLEEYGLEHSLHFSKYLSSHYLHFHVFGKYL